MAPPKRRNQSLVGMCRSVMLKNLRGLKDVGDTPYRIIRSTLLKIDDPKQLRVLEMNSPHLELEDKECWIRLINKKYKLLHCKENFTPSDSRSWYAVYDRYQKLDMALNQEAMAKMAQNYAAINDKKASNLTTIVSSTRGLPRLPANVRDAHQPSTTGRRGGNNDTGELKWTTGSRTNTDTAQGVMRKVRREVKQIADRNRLSIPTGQLTVKPGQIKQAPEHMVREAYIKRVAPKIPALDGSKSSIPTARPLPVPTKRYAEQERLKTVQEEKQLLEKEQMEKTERLRRLKEGQQPKLAGPISESDDKDDKDVDSRRQSLSSSSHLSDSPSSRLAPLPVKRMGMLARKACFARTRPSLSQARVEPPPPPPPSVSPSRPTASVPSRAFEPEPPRACRKRKPVDIFMRRNPKVPRTS